MTFFTHLGLLYFSCSFTVWCSYFLPMCTVNSTNLSRLCIHLFWFRHITIWPFTTVLFGHRFKFITFISNCYWAWKSHSLLSLCTLFVLALCSFLKFLCCKQLPRHMFLVWIWLRGEANEHYPRGNQCFCITFFCWPIHALSSSARLDSIHSSNHLNRLHELKYGRILKPKAFLHLTLVLAANQDGLLRIAGNKKLLIVIMGIISVLLGRVLLNDSQILNTQECYYFVKRRWQKV